MSKVLVSAACHAIANIAHFIAVALATRAFFDYLASDKIDMQQSVEKIAFLVCTMVIVSIFKQQAMHLGFRLGCYVKSAFLTMIYEKSLKIKSTGYKSIGEFVNLCSNDATRLYEASFFVCGAFFGPFQLLAGAIYLGFYFGKSAIIGSSVFLLHLPLSILLGRLYARKRRSVMKHSDERVKMVTEAVTFVKLIKMYAWEMPFAKKIFGLRSKERNSIQSMAFIEAFGLTLAYCLSYMAPVITIISAVYLEEEITVAKTFTMLTIFGIASSAMGFFQQGLRTGSELVVTLKRLEAFMNLEERKIGYEEPSNEDDVIELQKASFCWNNPDKTNTENSCVQEDQTLSVTEDATLLNQKDNDPQIKVLSQLHLTVKKKSLIGVCGPVGSGKSSLLMALLHEMEQLEGVCNVSKSIAYVPQQPWIMNDTLRENVLLGLPYHKERFDMICGACALDKDISDMESGDLTEIGERGINLSGGQKQRLSLARALYSDKELYLLDDPLSAVDAHVGLHIFDECIQNALRVKTVVMVTHQLQYLKDCDYVVYMKNGCFVEQGTYQDLMTNDQEFAAEIKKYTKEYENDEDNETNNAETKPHVTTGEVPSMHDDEKEKNEGPCGDEEEQKLLEKGKITSAEHKSQGAVTMGTYVTFFNYCGGFIAFFLILLTNSGGVILQIVSDYWLSYWIKNKDFSQFSNINPLVNISNTSNNLSSTIKDIDTEYYMTVYCIIAACMLLVTFASCFITVVILLRGSTLLHNAVFKALFNATMEFFDTTPSGRILNCLSKDVDEIDSYLPGKMIAAIRFFTRGFGYLFFIGVAIPWFLIPFFFICIAFLLLNHIFRKTIRAVKRIENVSRSPVFSHLSTTLQGLTSIRTFQKERHFIKLFRLHLDKNINALFYFGVSQRWYGLNMDFLCHACTLITAILVIAMRDYIPASVGALCVSYAMLSTGRLQFAFRLIADVEARFTSVERLLYYIRSVKPEDAGVCKNKTEPKTKENWPQNGCIEFEGVSLRYRDHLPFVLKETTFSINDKEKIGIVGRTGAGKSSITVAMYRLVNPSSGTIRISGVDTRQLDLDTLRRELTIIPQDPVLFIGTIRYNLDPLREFDDQQLWDALQKAHIKDMVSNLPEKLESEVLENGSNFSVGERQLICLARAALRKTKILMLDEATASIDANSDSKIQDTIKESFSNCTILTIAHRLNTIMHCDRIMVMHDGKVVEFDTPLKLLSKDSKFKEIAKAANISLSANDARM
uniref:Multidrug resistance-associated protein 5 n=2 Tax=Clytia hemisphaerica TaxID=252671 RepID=A0A7M5WZJ7_9CNID